MSLEVVKVGKAKSDDDIVRMLSELVEDAKAGKIHSLVVVGVDKYEGVTHRIRHRVDAATIGSLSCMLQDLQREWNG
jgi:hypothetical protein